MKCLHESLRTKTTSVNNIVLRTFLIVMRFIYSNTCCVAARRGPQCGHQCSTLCVASRLASARSQHPTRMRHLNSSCSLLLVAARRAGRRLPCLANPLQLRIRRRCVDVQHPGRYTSRLKQATKACEASFGLRRIGVLRGRPEALSRGSSTRPRNVE